MRFFLLNIPSRKNAELGFGYDVHSRPANRNISPFLPTERIATEWWTPSSAVSFMELSLSSPAICCCTAENAERKMFPVDQIRKQIFRYRRENGWGVSGASGKEGMSTYFSPLVKQCHPPVIVLYRGHSQKSSLSSWHISPLPLWQYRIIGQERFASKFCVLTRCGFAAILDVLPWNRNKVRAQNFRKAP